MPDEFALIQRHPFGWLHRELPSLNRKRPASHPHQSVNLMVLPLPCVTDEGFLYQIERTLDEACLATG
jgi:hypothetical protein